MNCRLVWGLTCLAITIIGNAAWADAVVLVNGDALHGDVVSFNGETLHLKSETLGDVELARENVASVHFGEVRLDRTQTRELGDPSTARAHQAQTPEQLIGGLTGERTAPSAGANAPTVADAVRQLQSGGLSGQTMAEVQKALPLVNTPEVQEYFNSTVGGLMGGGLTIQDVRKDAVKARDMILDLKKDLGPGADALNGYLSILEGFIEETAPSADAAQGPSAGAADGPAENADTPAD